MYATSFTVDGIHGIINFKRSPTNHMHKQKETEKRKMRTKWANTIKLSPTRKWRDIFCLQQKWNENKKESSCQPENDVFSFG